MSGEVETTIEVVVGSREGLDHVRGCFSNFLLAISTFSTLRCPPPPSPTSTTGEGARAEHREEPSQRHFYVCCADSAELSLQEADEEKWPCGGTNRVHP